MNQIKQILKRLPGVRELQKAVQTRHDRRKLRTQSRQQVFTEIFQTNTWGASDSRSGPGSEQNQTERVRCELPALCQELNIETLLDIPCGDFHWMKNVNLEGIQYIGADIVPDLIKANIQQFANHVNSPRFSHLDLIAGELPTVDLVFCRDCLVHLSHAEVVMALRNICKSQSTWLLTTTFTDRSKNSEILTGEWRPLNLQVAPFFLPPPTRVIVENCTEGNGIHGDKSLALWKTSTVAKCLENNQVFAKAS